MRHKPVNANRLEIEFYINLAWNVLLHFIETFSPFGGSCQPIQPWPHSFRRQTFTNVDVSVSFCNFSVDLAVLGPLIWPQSGD